MPSGQETEDEGLAQVPVFHAKDHETPMKGFGRRETYLGLRTHHSGRSLEN